MGEVDEREKVRQASDRSPLHQNSIIEMTKETKKNVAMLFPHVPGWEDPLAACW